MGVLIPDVKLNQLTPQEKASLARILIDELDTSSDTDVERLWIAESQRRHDAYLRGELESVAGEEVMSKARTASNDQLSFPLSS